MNEYTYNLVLTGGPDAATSLRLSPTTVTYAKETSLKATAVVTSLSGRAATGKVVITGDKKTICTITRLTNGDGSCAPSSGTILPVGRFTLTATYSGNLTGSTGTATLAVSANHATRTTLKLSAAAITYKHEKSLKITAAAKAVYGGRLTGKIVITEGGKAICTITRLSGTGTCSPPATRSSRPARTS